MKYNALSTDVKQTIMSEDIKVHVDNDTIL